MNDELLLRIRQWREVFRPIAEERPPAVRESTMFRLLDLLEDVWLAEGIYFARLQRLSEELLDLEERVANTRKKDQEAASHPPSTPTMPFDAEKGKS